MHSDGRGIFWDIDCLFIENQEGMFIYPINEMGSFKLGHHISETDFSLIYKNSTFKNSFISVHKMTPVLSSGYQLTANYIIEQIDDTPISMMEITCEAMDSLFSTSHYYYQKRCQEKSNFPDLLYGIDLVNTWQITHKSKAITILLFYGEVLLKGVASDTKIHPKLRLSFPETNDPEEIYEIYTIIKLFLQIARYGYSLGVQHVDLYSTDNGKKSHHGYLFDYSQKDKECSFSEIRYEYIKDHISDYLQFAADNCNLQVNYFPNKFRSTHDDSYNGLLFASLYAAFESECHKNPGLYEYSDDTLYTKAKKEILDFVKEKKKLNGSELSLFYDSVTSRINQFGTQIGQQRKIENAYNMLSDALNHSLQYIFSSPEFRVIETPDEHEIKKIAKTINDFRGKVIHTGEKNSFSSTEIPFVRFLEILVYSMMLKRVGLPYNLIELINGVVFRCNYALFEYWQGKEHKA